MTRRMAPLSLLVIALTLSCRSGTASDGRVVLPDLQTELRTLRQAGIPTTAEALQEPLPPPERNAAPLYLELASLLKSRPVSSDDKVATDFSSRGPLTADKARRLRAALQHRSDIGRLIHRAAERPECVFTHQWSQGLETTFPELVNMRMAARWISGESALLLYDGKPLEAVRQLEAGFRISGQLAKSRTMICYLVHLAVDAITLAGMERILYAAGSKPEVARAVRSAVETRFPDMGPAHALGADVYFVLNEMDKLRKEGPNTYDRAIKEFAKDESKAVWPALAPGDRQNWNGFVDRVEVAIASNQASIIAAADLPFPQANSAYQKVLAEVRAHDSDPTYVYARQLVPIWAPVISKRAMIAARARSRCSGQIRALSSSPRPTRPTMPRRRKRR